MLTENITALEDLEEIYFALEVVKINHQANAKFTNCLAPLKKLKKLEIDLGRNIFEDFNQH